jgi:hypothetical protein
LGFGIRIGNLGSIGIGMGIGNWELRIGNWDLGFGILGLGWDWVRFAFGFGTLGVEWECNV